MMETYREHQSEF